MCQIHISPCPNVCNDCARLLEPAPAPIKLKLTKEDSETFERVQDNQGRVMFMRRREGIPSLGEGTT